MHLLLDLLHWLSRHDRGYAAVRRAARAAIVMPAMFALGDKVIGNAEIATFAAFGSFALLLLVDFSGSMRERLQAQAALAVSGAVFVCIGTLASRNAWLAAAAMTVIGFTVIFSGVVSSVLAGATTSLLLAFILPVSLPGPVSAIPDRLAGWGLASIASLLAVALLWPAPTRDPLRTAAALACRTLAARLRTGIATAMDDRDEALRAAHELAVKQADDAVAALHSTFLATPYRPTGLSTVNRRIVRLVDELSWLNAIVVQSGQQPADTRITRASPAVHDVKLAVCVVLERAADLLEMTVATTAELHTATAELSQALDRMDQKVDQFVTALDPGFRSQELGFAVTLIAQNVDVAVAAARRSWIERLLGHQPDGESGALASAQERAAAHVERHSVWLHNSVRGAVGLGLAVLVADLSGVQHSFWVILGTLSVLRSNALNTGQNVLRGLLGTVAGFVIGAGVLALIGTNDTVLWFLLPPAILVAGIAPAAISFAAGQAAFTVVLVILFNIIQPTGWRVGLLRIEDIAIGCAVSLVVGVLFWPRGARAALRRALAEAYTDSADYLAGAVDLGMSHEVPTADRVQAAAASRRLDDAFRNYLAERGSKPIPLAHATSLITGVTGIRLAADAVLDLWEHDDGSSPADRTTARRELLATNRLVRDWYDDLATSLLDPDHQPPDPLRPDEAADGRLVEAVRRELHGADGEPTATAIRIIWTADHLDAVRRLQPSVAGPLREARIRRLRR